MGLHPVSTPGLLSLASLTLTCQLCVCSCKYRMKGSSGDIPPDLSGREELELGASVGFTQSLALVSGSLGLRLQLLLVDFSAYFSTFLPFSCTTGPGAVVSFSVFPISSIMLETGSGLGFVMEA